MIQRQGRKAKYENKISYRPEWLICVPELGVDNNLLRLHHEGIKCQFKKHLGT